MTPSTPFRFEIGEPSTDEHGNKLTTVMCHGRLVYGCVNEIREKVRALIPLGGRIVIDLGDVNYLDSTGLGTLVSLKATANKQGTCTLQFVNLSERIAELLRLMNLSQLLT